MKIIGVTKCPTGIAHTYMAAARIEKECERLGYEVKVETQGSQGTENKLTKREIAKADYVIIAADVVIEEPERFYGKWVLKTRIKPLLKNTQGVFERLEQDSFIMGGASFQNENNQNRNENSGNIENFQNKNAKDKNAENTEDKNIENREKNGDAVKQNITYQNAINRSRIVENTQENQKAEKIVGKGYRQELENEQSIAGRTPEPDTAERSAPHADRCAFCGKMPWETSPSGKTYLLQHNGTIRKCQAPQTAQRSLPDGYQYGRDPQLPGVFISVHPASARA